MWQQQEEQYQQHKKLQPQQRLVGGVGQKMDEPQSRFKSLPNQGKKSMGRQPPVEGSTLKSKRKSGGSLMKIAETSQLVNRFARNRGSAGSSQQLQQQQQQQQQQQTQRLIFKTPAGATTAAAGRMHSAGGAATASGRPSNKFKTGGLVVTAVQQPSHMPGGGSSSRRMRNAAAGGGLIPYQRSGASIQMNKSSAGISLDTVNLVRKVKTKLKKRKSRTLSNAHGAAK